MSKPDVAQVWASVAAAAALYPMPDFFGAILQPEMPAQAPTANVETKPEPVVAEAKAEVKVADAEKKVVEAEKPAAASAPTKPSVPVLTEAEAKKKAEAELKAAQAAEKAAKVAEEAAAEAAKAAAKAAAEAAKLREIAIARKVAKESSEKQLRAKLLLNSTVSHAPLKQVTGAYLLPPRLCCRPALTHTTTRCNMQTSCTQGATDQQSARTCNAGAAARNRHWSIRRTLPAPSVASDGIATLEATVARSAMPVDWS